MKSVTVREAQHNLAKILKAVEGGETVEIMRRRLPVARLSPAPSATPARTNWDGHSKRLNEIWGTDRIEAIDETLDDLRGAR
jgi:antitoxin (DNA-binding transcriptional repressor) of toxin-antitoxin stability system